MRARAAVYCLGALTVSASALAQPFIIPLGGNRGAPAGSPGQGSPVVSAPPVAPPQAGPSLPSTTDVAGASPQVGPHEETASEPPPRP